MNKKPTRRSLAKSFRALLLVLALPVLLDPQNAEAQAKEKQNVFFGFGMILAPIAVKWACGGASDADILHMETMIADYPEDAREAQFEQSLASLVEAMNAGATVEEVLGGPLSEEQTDRLCTVALDLSLAPAEGVTKDEWQAQSERAWGAFWSVFETL